MDTTLDPLLQHIVFATLLGGTKSVGLNPYNSGSAQTYARALAVDRSGNSYVAGSTNSIDFPVSANALQTRPPSISTYAFLVEISPNGTQIVFSTYFGGDRTQCGGFPDTCNGGLGPIANTGATAVAVDGTGAIVIAGGTDAMDLPVTSGVYARQCTCTSLLTTGFIAKFKPGGAQLAWATYLNLSSLPPSNGGLGPPLYVGISTMMLAGDGGVVLGGVAPPGLPITSGALQGVYPSVEPSLNSPPEAGFVAKLDSLGQRLIFSTYLGGNFSNGTTNGVAAIALDAQGNIYATGGSVPSELPVDAGTPLIGPTYTATLSPDGTRLLSIFTAPDGAAGRAVIVTARGTLMILGANGSLLIDNQTAGPSLMGVANSAAFVASNGVAPFELASLYGIGLGPSKPMGALVVSGVVTASLGGVQVLFDGVAAPLLYVGPNQINLVVPGKVYGRDVTSLQIVTPQGSIRGLTLYVRRSQPQAFRNPAQVATREKVAWALNQDGTVNSSSNPAVADSVVSIWATGMGYFYPPIDPDGTIATSRFGLFLPTPVLPVSVISRDSLEVLYAANAPGFVEGAIQINFRVSRQNFQGYTPNLMLCQIQVGGALSDGFIIYVNP